MLLLARRALGLPRLPALVAAVAFMATPRLISHLGAGHITIVQTVAWFPWLALACWATVREPHRWGAALGVCFAMTLLAGHPQIAYYALLMTAGLATWLLIRLWRMNGWRSMLKPIAGLVGAGVVGVLIAAVFLLPLAEFTAYSTRQKEIGSGDTFPLLDFLQRLIIPPSLPGVPWEVMLTPGLVVLFLAMLTLVLRWRKTWPLLLGIVLVAGLAMGNASPLYIVAAHILPGFDRFRGPARIWFVALVSITLLAGIGTDALLQLVQRRFQRGSLAVGVLAVLVVAATLVPMDWSYTLTGSVNVATIPSQLDRTASQLAGSGRIYDAQDYNILQADAVLMQTRLASGWNPLMIQSYVEYMHSAGDYDISGYQLHIPRYDGPQVQPRALLLGWMNVSVVVSQHPMTDPHLTLQGRVDSVYIYKNPLDAGSAYLVSPAANGAVPSLDAMQKLNVPIHTVKQTPEQETYTFTSNTRAYLVLAEPTFPGWTARLDGNVVSPQIIAKTMPAIQVGPGTHTLSYSYEPSSVRNGAILSVLGLLAMFAWLLAIVFWKPRKRQTIVEERGEEVVDEPAGAIIHNALVPIDPTSSIEPSVQQLLQNLLLKRV
jgi:hypothetical protein